MTRLACDGPTLIRSVAAAVANLERHVAEVDALNVFPVPDGDTGSNMLATMRAALAEAEGLAPDERDLGRVATAIGRGALRGARGNSGVILAQILRGMTDGIDGRRRATGADLAAGLRRGAVAAYGSVVSPVEGTILTVIRDTAAAAEVAAESEPHVETVLDVAIEAATWSVARTPRLLPILAETGVVDSGGQGLLRLLEGTRQLDGSDAGGGRWSSPDAPASTSVHLPAPVVDGYGYETMFLVESPDEVLDLDALRHELGEVGESVVVAGDRSAARVHVHGAQPDLAIAVGLRAGRLSDIAIVDLDVEAADPSHHPAAGATTGRAPARSRSLELVVVAEADGTAALVASLGASVVRSASGIAEAVAGADAEHVLLLIAGDDDAPADPPGTATATTGPRARCRRARRRGPRVRSGRDARGQRRADDVRGRARADVRGRPRWRHRRGHGRRAAGARGRRLRAGHAVRRPRRRWRR